MINVTPIKTLSRNGRDLVGGWRAEVVRNGGEWISFCVTSDLQVWHCSYWVEGGFREWIAAQWVTP